MAIHPHHVICNPIVGSVKQWTELNALQWYNLFIHCTSAKYIHRKVLTLERALVEVPESHLLLSSSWMVMESLQCALLMNQEA